MKNICTLIKGIYEDFGDLGYDRLITFEQHHWIFSITIFSLVWTAGSLSKVSDQGLSLCHSLIISGFLRVFKEYP